MKIRHIALQHIVKFQEQIFKEKVEFLTKYPHFIPLVMIANYIREHYKLIKSDEKFFNGISKTWNTCVIPAEDEQKWKNVLGINETTKNMWPKLKTAFEQMTADKSEIDRLIRDEIGQDMDDFLNNISKNTKKDIRRMIMPAIEIPLQKYWLAWLDDFFEEIVHNTITIIPPDLYNTTLVIVTFPEFIYSFPEALGDSFIYYRKSVVDSFLSGALPDNFQRRPKISNLRKLKNIQQYFHSTLYNILVVPGTIVWKDYPARYTKYVLYNTIPVFHQNKCIFAWDKQNVSLEDIGKKGVHQRINTITRQLNPGTRIVSYSGAASLSNLSMKINKSHNPVPCFQIEHITQTIHIGLSTCLDFSFSRYIIGREECQIQILIACGYQEPWSLSPQLPDARIVAGKLFIYCDMKDLMTYSEMGAAVMLSRDNKDLWQQEKQKECEWGAIDPELCLQQLEERRDKLIAEKRMLSIDIQTVNF